MENIVIKYTWKFWIDSKTLDTHYKSLGVLFCTCIDDPGDLVPVGCEGQLAVTSL